MARKKVREQRESSRLAALIRSDKATPEQRARYVELDAAEQAARKRMPAPRGLYDLPIFEWAWRGDARDVEGR